MPDTWLIDNVDILSGGKGVIVRLSGFSLLIGGIRTEEVMFKERPWVAAYATAKRAVQRFDGAELMPKARIFWRRAVGS